jgi:hypothetical protein
MMIAELSARINRIGILTVDLWFNKWPRHGHDTIGPSLGLHFKNGVFDLGLDLWLRWWPFCSVKPGNIIVEFIPIRTTFYCPRMMK